MIITHEQLKALGACADQLAMFVARFGESVEVTMANVDACAQGFNVAWLAQNVLPARLLAEYERQRALLWAEYGRQHAPLWAAYDRQRALSLAEYDRQHAALWAEYKRQHVRVLLPLLEEHSK
jgi:hypothetical protein